MRYHLKAIETAAHALLPSEEAAAFVAKLIAMMNEDELQVLPFGRHKDETLGSVLRKPEIPKAEGQKYVSSGRSYLRWLLTTDSLYLDPERAYDKGALRAAIERLVGEPDNPQPAKKPKVDTLEMTSPVTRKVLHFGFED